MTQVQTDVYARVLPAIRPGARFDLVPAVLATLTYHDLLELPLSAVQVWRYLLRPRELGIPNTELGTPPLGAVEQTLTELVRRGRVHTRWGFYFFPGRDHLVDAWIEKHARSQEKWKRLRRIVWWLQAVPFLRGVAGTGSLAFENAKPASDLDVLIIAGERRVWTVRFLLTVLLDLFRLRRRPSGPTENRVCLNHYLAADALHFPYQSLYTALEYARLVPILGEETCHAFRAANRGWITEYLMQVFPDDVRHQKTVRESSVLRRIQHGLEWLLRGRFGAYVETVLARLQRARIARTEETPAPPGRVIATETQAEFHPQSREAPLLRTFNQRIETLGLTEQFGRQADSGLR